MENLDDEGEFLDYRRPKAQLIKLVEQKCKKPVIDDSLGEILDKFIKLNADQDKYLENGIFHMNFAEDALLLQGCTNLYAKRVDKLWEELLQLHTGLVKCDQKIDKDDKNNGQKLEARQQELMKLEERLNRRKRKKITLLEHENPNTAAQSVLRLECMDMVDDLLSSEDADVAIGEESKIPFELDDETLTTWREMELKKSCSIESSMSPLVVQFHRQTYRMKNYLRPKDDDDIIYDIDDPEEFYSRRSRIPSYDVIMHLFEYNDRCLVPDNKNATIAKLRLAFVVKKKYMIKHHITFQTPYEQYKEHYEKFLADFFEKERKKIQNMPQNTKEEIQAFYRALEKKEEEAWAMKRKLKAMGVQSPNVNFDTVILDPLEREDGKTIWRVLLSEHGVEEEEEQDPDMQALHSQEDFAIDLDQVNKAADDKLRSDSGYFESGFATDDEIDRDDAASETLGDDEHAEGSNAEVSTEENSKDKTNEGNTEQQILEADNIESSQQPNADSVLLDSSLQSASGAGTEVSMNEGENTENLRTDAATNSLENLNKEGEECAENLNKDGKITETLYTDGTINSEEGSNKVNESNSDSNEELFKDKSDEAPEDSSIAAINPNCLSKSEQIKARFDEFIKDHKYTKFSDGCIMIEYNQDTSVAAVNPYCMSKSEQIKARFDEFIKDHKYTEFSDGCIMIEYNKDESKGKKDNKLNITLEEEVATKQAKLEQKNIVKEDGKNKKTKGEKCGLKRKLEASDEIPIKRRKLSAKQLEKLRKSVIEPVHSSKWESFFSLNYQTESGEGDVVRVNYERDIEEENDHADYHSDVESHVSDHSYTRPESCQPENGRPDSAVDMLEHNTTPLHIDSINDDETELNLHTENFESEPQPGCSSWPDSVEDGRLLEDMAAHAESMRQSEYLSNKTKYEIEREEVRKSVAEWRAHIVPKLKQLDEHDFDIHEYGANIIGKFDNVNERRPFKSMVDGKSSAEVVRYFISSLQMANTYNIEICGAQKGQLSNETFELKLLDKERYHEHLEGYQAPSEEGLNEKLKKIKMIKEQEKNASKKSKSNSKSSKKSNPELRNFKVLLDRAPLMTNDEYSQSNVYDSGYQSAIMSPSTSTHKSYSRIKHNRSVSTTESEKEEDEMPAPKKIKILSCYSVKQGQRTRLDFNRNDEATTSAQEPLRPLNDDSLLSSDLSADETTFFDDLQSGGYSQSTPRKSSSYKSTKIE